MTDQELIIEVDAGEVEGHRLKLRITPDEDWAEDKLRGDTGPRRIVLRAADDDVEGHAMSSTLRVRAFEGDDDTEGHAISIHFPSREEAEAFRRRLMVTGVLAGTLALGAAGGIGLANLGSGDAAGTGAVTSAGSAAGMDRTQAERPGQAAGAGSAEDEAESSSLGGPTPR